VAQSLPFLTSSDPGSFRFWEAKIPAVVDSRLNRLTISFVLHARRARCLLLAQAYLWGALFGVWAMRSNGNEESGCGSCHSDRDCHLEANQCMMSVGPTPHTT